MFSISLHLLLDFHGILGAFKLKPVNAMSIASGQSQSSLRFSLFLLAEFSIPKFQFSYYLMTRARFSTLM